MMYAIYSSTKTGVTGCVQRFATMPQEDAAFSPRVNWHCSLCDEEHQFGLKTIYSLDTPSKVRNFTKFCKEQSITENINVN